MITISKQQASNSLLMEYYADRHILKEKIELMERKFKCSLSEFEKRISSSKEHFENWEAFIEWKAFQASLNSIELKISELEHGEFSLA